MSIATRAVPVAAILTMATLAAGSWEGAKTFEAKNVLAPEERKGPHHTVDDVVLMEGFYFAFGLHTDFGRLEPVGRGLLHKRLLETDALVRLREVSKTGAFVKAAGRSLESVGTGVADVARDPEGTARGLGRGFKRFGVNLGRKASRTVDDVKNHDDDEGQGSKEDEEKTTTETVANAALGVNKAARVWAEKLDVDPYSRNSVLQAALIEIAKIDRAGGIAAKVVVPIPPVVTTTSSVSSLVWGKDPEELRKLNESHLWDLRVPKETAKNFFRNEAFTLTDQTRFIGALHAVKVPGLADYVDAAHQAESPREALFFVWSAEMLERQHSQEPVSQVLTDSRALVAASGDRAIALLPLDYVSWTEEVARAGAEIAGRARAELGASGLEMHLTGRVSRSARRELEALGWTVREDVPATAERAE